MAGRQKDDEMFFLFTSFVYPSTIYRYDFKTRTATPLRKSAVDFDPSQRGFYDIWAAIYADGSPVSGTLHITELDGNHP